MNTLAIKLKLRSLERIPHEQFVLHGSRKRSNTLIPKRPKLESWRNKRKARHLLQKAVYATRVIAIAVIYASLPNDAQWRYVKKGRYIRVLHREPEISIYPGYIHVCRRTSFNRGALITTSKHPVRVVKTYKIPPEMLQFLWGKKQIRFFDTL